MAMLSLTEREEMELVDAMLDQIPFEFNDITEWNIARDGLVDWLKQNLSKRGFK